MEYSRQKQITNLLIVLLSGVVSATLLAGVMLYYYGPSGQYIVKNVLLDPEMTSVLSYDDTNPNSGKNSHYVFDRIVYRFWSSGEKQWKEVSISTDLYKKFYRTIENGSNIEDIPDHIVNLFYKSKPSDLSIYVKSTGPSNDASTKVFQTVQFADKSDYYRIELREEKNIVGWTYYRHPGISLEASRLFDINN